ncbi:hypothetical protein SAMD00019534_021040 [Acytostelium subglobosum LB1]|uniref:hypothetical protein n=1 Tax=Acytostelium subglobosum LB1 TaxID=1410327 RepID=UPI000644AE46|nr:hypothetical protein SAMD00019534_021040 [Acytostelium subglobosum LB1]GAM18929.1 hypothetical protein SAMD00019534_021040 [Acytostelium subglobosum LB1]|eukprot:XP_012758149.1 hypothetical protein SAMD00019534_021040 [Acytostelium subglobosum LB1]
MSSITGQRRNSIMKELEKIEHTHLGTEYPTRPEDYTLLEAIGEGTEGIVWKAICNTLKVNVAIKIVDLEKQPPEAIEDVLREVKVMNENNHPNLVQYHTSFLHDSALWLVMDYLGAGSLADIIKEKFPKGMPEVMAITVLKYSLRGLAALHSHNRIHRDFKSDNILIGSDGQIEVADFGVTAIVGKASDNFRKTVVGTPCWMAPEIITEKGYNQSIDIWSFGITAIETIRGKPPNSDLAPNKVFMNLLFNSPPSLQEEVDAGIISANFKNMVDKCLHKDPTKRPSAAKLLEHKVFKYAKKNDYIVSYLLNDLSPCEDRFRKHHGPISPPLSGSNTPVTSNHNSRAGSPEHNTPTFVHPEVRELARTHGDYTSPNSQSPPAIVVARSNSSHDLMGPSSNMPRPSSHPELHRMDYHPQSPHEVEKLRNNMQQVSMESPPDSSSPHLKEHRKGSIFSHFRRHSITKIFTTNSSNNKSDSDGEKKSSPGHHFHLFSRHHHDQQHVAN